jgi:hypothetical protein
VAVTENARNRILWLPGRKIGRVHPSMANRSLMDGNGQSVIDGWQWAKNNL